MPKTITQYRVFIASPGGLKEEREQFRDLLAKYTRLHGGPRGVAFFPVGWEDTTGGAGRPQELINKDLEQCDYAVFVLHDRWGTPTGSGHSSGTEEEWRLAERLYTETSIRNIALFFKEVEPRQLRDPGDQLKKVLQFRSEIEARKKYLFNTFGTSDGFCDVLEGHLSKWLRDHEATAGASPSGGRGTVALSESAAASTPPKSTLPEAPGFDFWISEVDRLLDAEPQSPNSAGILFCAERAIEAAGSDTEWARAKNAIGVAYFYSNKPTESLAAFSEIAKRLDAASDRDERLWLAIVLFNEGLTLGQLSRSEEAIAAYDDVVARFGTAPEAVLREQVARALVSKGVTLGELKRGEEAIAAYDDAVVRFGASEEAILKGLVKQARTMKGGANLSPTVSGNSPKRRKKRSKS